MKIIFPKQLFGIDNFVFFSSFLLLKYSSSNSSFPESCLLKDIDRFFERESSEYTPLNDEFRDSLELEALDFVLGFLFFDNFDNSSSSSILKGIESFGVFGD